MTKKPTCESFIIEVMRDRRAKRPPSQPNISRPVSLDKIWHYVKYHYTESQFRRALNKLLKNGTVVGTWKKWERGVGTTYIAVEEINDNISIAQSWTHFNAAGEVLKSDAWNANPEGKVLSYLLSKFYVSEDGVPKSTQKIIKTTSPEKKAADDLMAKLTG